MAFSITQALAAPLGQAEYGVAEWTEVGRGSHRAVVRVAGAAQAVVVRIPWRRRDKNPEQKALLVFDSTTGKQITDVVPLSVTRESGVIAFAAPSAGNYEIYWLPYSRQYGNFDDPSPYYTPTKTASDTWLKSVGLTGIHARDLQLAGKLPAAKVVQIQARIVPLPEGRDFNRMDPMEVIATSEEKDAVTRRYPRSPFLVFPEDRRFPIRMPDDIPLRWTQKGPSSQFAGSAQPNEYYPFQIGVWAFARPLKNVRLTFSALKNSAGRTIPATNLRSINNGGNDFQGQPFRKIVDVAQGRVQALWVVVDVPKDAAGLYKGVCHATANGMPPVKVDLSLQVQGSFLADHGTGDAWRFSRLGWLDSKLAIDDEVVPPYIPLKIQKNTVSLLNRKVQMGENGLPAQIWSNGRAILQAPIHFQVETETGVTGFHSTQKTALTYRSPAKFKFKAGSTASKLETTTHTSVEADGCLMVSMSMVAREDVKLKDVSLRVPLEQKVARFMMGFGVKGGNRPEKLSWSWDRDRANNFGWFGDADAGLYLRLDVENPKQIGTADLHFRNISRPAGWWNEGRGGVAASQQNDSFELRAFSGDRQFKKGQKLTFNFQLLVTPFKTLDWKHWQYRATETIVHIHHAAPNLNEYISYPFWREKQLRDSVAAWKKSQQTLSLYYTLRDLSNWAAELPPLLSLGSEIISPTGGLTYSVEKQVEGNTDGGYAWLKEHVVTGYGPSWYQTLYNGEADAAIATNGLSRFSNFYVEGMDWLSKKTDLEGLYLDGIGYNRDTMKRVAKVMYRHNPNYHINYHGGNTYAFLDLRVNSLGQRMELMPYFTSLWVGEMFDYNESPEFYLVEMSGLPFGLGSEALAYDPPKNNAWRGMLYGMMGRFMPQEASLFNLWDLFGIQDSKIVGWWNPQCPVKTGHENIRATAYTKPRAALIAVASWDAASQPVRLTIDWKKLGLDPLKTRISHPEIGGGFQNEQVVDLNNPITVEPGKGFILVLEEKELPAGKPIAFDPGQGSWESRYKSEGGEPAFYSTKFGYPVLTSEKGSSVFQSNWPSAEQSKAGYKFTFDTHFAPVPSAYAEVTLLNKGKVEGTLLHQGYSATIYNLDNRLVVMIARVNAAGKQETLWENWKTPYAIDLHRWLRITCEVNPTAAATQLTVQVSGRTVQNRPVDLPEVKISDDSAERISTGEGIGFRIFGGENLAWPQAVSLRNLRVDPR